MGDKPVWKDSPHSPDTTARNMIDRAWKLIAGAMSGNPHKPTANSDWMDAAHAWEIDYCMGQGSSVPEYPTVSYRVRDRDSDYKAMCHEDRDHAELLLKAWLADGRDAVIERRHVFDGGWLPVGRPFFTEQQERNLARCEAFDRASEPRPDPDVRDGDWRCLCGDLNREHEACCFRCGGGNPAEPMPDEPFFTDQQERSLARCEAFDRSSEPRPENPYRTVHARMSPPGAAWDEGFASRQPEIDRLTAAFDAVVAERDRAIKRADDNVAKFEAEREDERERLSARVYENGWCPTCGRTVGES